MATAHLRKSGQSTSHHAGDDGASQVGVEVPSYTDNANGTVTDIVSELIWLKYANSIGPMTWSDALTFVNALASGDLYGLADSSTAGQWRVPNLLELQSIVDVSKFFPPLASGHPFINVQPDAYWSSTTVPDGTERAYIVRFDDGIVSSAPKTEVHYVWAVKG